MGSVKSTHKESREARQMESDLRKITYMMKHGKPTLQTDRTVLWKVRKTAIAFDFGTYDDEILNGTSNREPRGILGGG